MPCHSGAAIRIVAAMSMANGSGDPLLSNRQVAVSDEMAEPLYRLAHASTAESVQQRAALVEEGRRLRNNDLLSDLQTMVGGEMILCSTFNSHCATPCQLQTVQNASTEEVAQQLQATQAALEVATPTVPAVALFHRDRHRPQASTALP